MLGFFQWKILYKSGSQAEKFVSLFSVANSSTAFDFYPTRDPTWDCYSCLGSYLPRHS